MCSWKGCLYDLMKCFGFGVETLQGGKIIYALIEQESTTEIWYFWYFCPYHSYVFISRHMIESDKIKL